MTVSSTTTKNSYSGDGSTTVFAYTFKIFDEADVTVILRATDGTETTQTISTNYTVSGVGNAGGGNVTFTTAPTSSQTVVLIRETSRTQNTDYTPNDPFPAESHEDALDKLTFMVQELEEELGRSIKVSKTNTITSTEFTIGATDRANKIFAFDSDGDFAVTQEIGSFRGTDGTTTTAAYKERDIVKSTTAAQLDNVYIALQDSPVGTLLTNTTYWALLVDAYSAASASTTATTKAAEAATSATNAATSASTATTKASEASTSATSAETAKTAAETAQSAAESAQASAEAAQTAAETAQTAAETAETNAETAETNAGTSETNAATSATTASTKATEAATSATNAATSATTATTKATEAASSATDAQGSEDEAEAWAQKIDGEAVTGEGYSSKAWATGGTGVTDTAGSGAAKEWAIETASTVDGTEYSAKEYAIGSQAGNTSGSAKQWALGGGASYATNTTVDGTNYSAKYWAEQAAASVDSFDDTYLGSKSSDPTLDNDGNALATGAIYFSTTANKLRVYDGTNWNDAVTDLTGVATNGFAIAMAIAL